MAEQIQLVLDEFEGLVAAGNITAFKVKITGSDLVLFPHPNQTGGVRRVTLPEALLTSLQLFFSEAEAIGYGSFDYTTLRSLINAHEILNRMTALKGNQK